MSQHNYETRWFFWDGARNIRAKGSSEPLFDLTDRWLLPAQPAPVRAADNDRVLFAPQPRGKLRLLPAAFVHVRKCDPAFVPVDELLAVELGVLGGEDASLLIRVYADQQCVYQRAFDAAAIRRLPTADLRTGPSKKGNPHADKSRAAISPGADPFAAARGATITVRAWARPYGLDFEGVDLEIDAAHVPGYRDPGHPLPRLAERDPRDLLANDEHARLGAKGATGLGRNQAITQGRSKVQFVAFQVKPGATWDNVKQKYTGYFGTGKLEDDLAAQADIMKAAIKAAHAHASIDQDPGTLKVFMAPEFFFRGGSGGAVAEGDGGLPLQHLAGQDAKTPGLFDLLREETKDPKYAGWLFVLGSATAYQRHDATDVTAQPPPPVQKPLEYPLYLHSVDQFKAENTYPAWTRLNFTRPSKDYEDLKSLSRRVTPTHWQVIQQTGVNTFVKESVRYVWPGTYQLGIPASVAFKPGPCRLVEPIATEIFNVALVQRGGPPPPTGGLSDAIVYKEWASSVDFLGDNYGKHAEFDLPDGRVVKLHNDPQRAILPVDGSTDVKGNALGAGRSEWNRSGLGGGGVFVVDGVTFGLEVCRDHGRLARYYQAAHPGEPKVQVQLIPAMGKTILKDAVCAIPGGLVFNVDGATPSSEAVIVDGKGTKEQWKAAPFSFDENQAATVFGRIGDRTPVALKGAAVNVVHAKLASYFVGGAVAVYEAKPLPPPEAY